MKWRAGLEFPGVLISVMMSSKHGHSLSPSLPLYILQGSTKIPARCAKKTCSIVSVPSVWLVPFSHHCSTTCLLSASITVRKNVKKSTTVSVPVQRKRYRPSLWSVRAQYGRELNSPRESPTFLHPRHLSPHDHQSAVRPCKTRKAQGLWGWKAFHVVCTFQWLYSSPRSGPGRHYWTSRGHTDLGPVNWHNYKTGTISTVVNCDNYLNQIIHRAEFPKM